MKKKTHDALSNLASKIEYGALLADTNPPAFLKQVADELDTLRARVAALEKVLRVAEKIRDHHNSRTDRIKAFRALASVAQQTGQSQSHKIPDLESKHPVVWDLGDLVNELCSAMDQIPSDEGDNG